MANLDNNFHCCFISESAKKQMETMKDDKLNAGHEALKKHAEALVTSTPLRERPETFGEHQPDYIKESLESEMNTNKEKEVKSSKELFSEEAQLILNTTPELNQESTKEVFAAESALSTNSLSKPSLSVEELMVSQMSLDSSRLGHLQEQRRVTPSLNFAAENGSSVNDLSLFAELSSEEPNLMTEMESASCLSSVGKELEGLIKENEELLSSK